MLSIRQEGRQYTPALFALAIFVMLAATPLLYSGTAGSPGESLAGSPDLLLRNGPPPCMGYTIDDSCITPKALAECRRAVAKCGDQPIAVILTCPLQFSCGG